MAEAQTEVDDIRAALNDEFRTAVAEAHRRIRAVVDPACPTPAFMTALAEELVSAALEPASVPYPELVDPDQYWTAAIQPQMRAVHEQVGSVLEWLDRQIVQTMTVAEADLKRDVDAALTEASGDPVADRCALQQTLQSRCAELHEQMNDLLTALPDPEGVATVQGSFAAALREQAALDVDSLHDAYLAEAGGDEAHQRFAEQQWTATYLERVAHREAMLAGVSPWRHQHLALVGYERICADTQHQLQRAVSRLQAPLGALPGLLLDRYDERSCG